MPWIGPFQAVLCDLDGTLIDSLPAVERVWTRFALEHGKDPAEIVPYIHGRRAIDSVRLLFPHLDPHLADAWLIEQETNDTEGINLRTGAAAFLESLKTSDWCVVTSGVEQVATARIAAAGIDIRAQNVYGNDVEFGKPNPDPFLLAAARLGVNPEDCIIFEDTTAGISAGAAAGMTTVSVVSSVKADHFAPIFPEVKRGNDGIWLNLEPKSRDSV